MKYHEGIKPVLPIETSGSKMLITASYLSKPYWPIKLKE
jgi:hypothetical protein